jgi:hypothetical protein
MDQQRLQEKIAAGRRCLSLASLRRRRCVSLKIAVLVAVLATTTSADARPGVIKAETYACTSWGAAHQYTLQSLTPKGGQFSKNCPIRLPAGATVDVVNEDDDGYAVVTHRGKTWWVDGERVR